MTATEIRDIATRALRSVATKLDGGRNLLPVDLSDVQLQLMVVAATSLNEIAAHAAERTDIARQQLEMMLRQEKIAAESRSQTNNMMSSLASQFKAMTGVELPIPPHALIFTIGGNDFHADCNPTQFLKGIALNLAEANGFHPSTDWRLQCEDGTEIGAGVEAGTIDRGTRLIFTPPPGVGA